MKISYTIAAAVLAMAIPQVVAANQPDRCTAGAIMMENLAVQRDAGTLSYGKALKGIANELEREIRDEPESRWFFIREAKDIDFLRDAIKDVFKSPKPPKVHAALFKSACKSITAI